ncbi:hypothetical protein KYG_23330 [Acidovorax sp. NO-1]|uniref:hypothetical protein n=1 Tax=Acidovorax sp. NO-1 TaxID=512030 RepID=UPI0002401E20|nr:hypothetical protein [Acidovorax sp. NO-1]EHL20375.1 hypothetical protein KYG_23330 [Acidovorax sp. NO-1]
MNIAPLARLAMCAALAAIAAWSVPAQGQLREGIALFVIIGGLWMTQALPLAVTALAVPLLAVLAGIMSVRQALNSSNMPHCTFCSTSFQVSTPVSDSATIAASATRVSMSAPMPHHAARGAPPTYGITGAVALVLLPWLVPGIAVAREALEMEVARMGYAAVRLARSVLYGTPLRELERDQYVVAQLDAAADAFVERMNRTAMAQGTSERLAQVLRVQRYYQTTAQRALDAARLAPMPGEPVRTQHTAFVEKADAVLALCDPLAGHVSLAEVLACADAMEASYQSVKAALLAAGAQGQFRLVSMEDSLGHLSALRHAAQQAVKARKHQRNGVEQEVAGEPAGPSPTVLS